MMFYFTTDELARLLAAAEASSPLHGLLLKTCYRHAFRISEALTLTPKNLRSGMLTVQRGKGGKITRQKPSAELLALIAAKRPDELLFPLTSGKPESARRQADRIIKRLCRKAGIEQHKAHSHAIRHSLVHHATDAGISLAQLTVVLGHSDPTSIMHYTRANEQEAGLAMVAVVGS
jgi:integrase